MSKDEYLKVFTAYTGEQDDLIPLLQHFQKNSGYISQECVREIARFLRVSENHIYGVASFYTQFTFTKPGRNHVKVCLGTACHVQGGQQIAQEVHNRLQLCSGEVAPDGRFDYHEVSCLGCCAQAAVVELNGKIYARMTAEKLAKKLGEYD